MLRQIHLWGQRVYQVVKVQRAFDFDLADRAGQIHVDVFPIDNVVKRSSGAGRNDIGTVQGAIDLVCETARVVLVEID